MIISEMTKFDPLFSDFQSTLLHPFFAKMEPPQKLFFFFKYDFERKCRFFPFKKHVFFLVQNGMFENIFCSVLKLNFLYWDSMKLNIDVIFASQSAR